MTSRLLVQKKFLSYSQELTSPHVSEESTLSWQPPSPGVYKLNFDEASFPDAGAETGVVVKDEKGFLISAMADRIPFITEPPLPC